MNIIDFFKKKNSGSVAKDRLKLLLVSDRANCSPEIMDMIKNDIINVISKYVEIDAEGHVFWGDSNRTIGANGKVQHTFADPGTYTIRVFGTIAPGEEEAE